MFLLFSRVRLNMFLLFLESGQACDCSVQWHKRKWCCIAEKRTCLVGLGNFCFLLFEMLSLKYILLL
jgi:hypothetical protein